MLLKPFGRWIWNERVRLNTCFYDMHIDLQSTSVRFVTNRKREYYWEKSLLNIELTSGPDFLFFFYLLFLFKPKRTIIYKAEENK
jgi:hypothetical protein